MHVSNSPKVDNVMHPFPCRHVTWLQFLIEKLIIDFGPTLWHGLLDFWNYLLKCHINFVGFKTICLVDSNILYKLQLYVIEQFKCLILTFNM